MSRKVFLHIISFFISFGECWRNISPAEKGEQLSSCNYAEVDYMLYSASMLTTKRIFLVGDPLIGDMCRETAFCSRTEDGLSTFAIKMKPNFSTPDNWTHFNRHQLNGAPQVSVYHLGQSKLNVPIVEKELFWNFHPGVADILIVLFGNFRNDKVPQNKNSLFDTLICFTSIRRYLTTELLTRLFPNSLR